MSKQVYIRINGEAKLANFGGFKKGTLKCPSGTFEFDNSGAEPISYCSFDACDAVTGEIIYSDEAHFESTPHVGDEKYIEYSEFETYNAALIDTLMSMGYTVDASQFPIFHVFSSYGSISVDVQGGGSTVECFYFDVLDINTGRPLYESYAQFPDMPPVGGTIYITQDDIEMYNPDIITYLNRQGKSLYAGQFPVEHMFETESNDRVEIYAQ